MFSGRFKAGAPKARYQCSGYSEKKYERTDVLPLLCCAVCVLCLVCAGQRSCPVAVGG